MVKEAAKESTIADALKDAEARANAYSSSKSKIAE